MELEELYKEIQPKVFAFFFVKTLHKEAAEDLTQEVFYEAIKGLHSFKHQSTVETWLFSIAKNRMKKHYRTKKYKNQLEAKMRNERIETDSPEDQFIIKETAVNLIGKIAQLAEPENEIVILRVYGELSFREIGSIIGRSENYARVTFYRAKLKLQKEMEGYHG
ncbi:MULTISPECIES: RNA polymerase sigma factor [Bacillus]|uniref:RNA polymerase subunit sigma-24 n=2 Tax=Bacillus TaxID=1386 RepID=A0A0M4FV19_9BACI|nr:MULTISPECIES: sigma-70 family RNA polymerase sigma factor [Bacillus]ALC82343.1 RNA polymerase subunit sigma-24 [Bacillus gobiensis]MBP1081210.1 RNA polymerase sigma-70 factor (ECF subfamily) [Bacillus capparidis]MED1095890.1 sigma-70 family RNA polymerase sigma factor [Bacillus capparidis]